MHVFPLSTPMGGRGESRALLDNVGPIFEKPKGALMATLVPIKSLPNLVGLLAKTMGWLYTPRGWLGLSPSLFLFPVFFPFLSGSTICSYKGFLDKVSFSDLFLA